MKTTIKSIIFLATGSFSFLFSEITNVLPSSITCSCFREIPNVGVNMELLVFQPKIEGLDYTISNSDTDRELNGKISALDLKWTSGARVGMTYLLNYDNWKLSLNGSFILLGQSQKAGQAVFDEDDDALAGNYGTFNGSGLIPIWSHPRAYNLNGRNIRYANGKSKWDFSFYSIDLALCKNFCISKKITIAPSFGLFDIFFYQKFFVHFTDGKVFVLPSGGTLTPNFSDCNNYQDTFGVGPKVGVQTKWYFYKNANIFANVHGALLYTFFYSKRADLYNFETTATGIEIEQVNMKKNFSSLKPALDIALGINFEKCLDTLFMRFSVAYEAEFYWKFNHFIRFADDLNYLLTYTARGDFQLHGLVIGLDLLF